MNLAQLLNTKKCVPIEILRGKYRLDFYCDEENEATKQCFDFPKHELYISTDPVNRKAGLKFVVDWQGQRAYCDSDCEWAEAPIPLK